MTTKKFWIVVVALSMGCTITAHAQTATSSEPGVPFVLHVGQSAALTGGIRITLTALTPQGACPGAHTECVAVSPPQAEVDVAENGAKPVHLVMLLPGAKSRAQAVGKWNVRIVDVTPFPLTEQDLTRASATLLVTPVSTPRE